MNSNKMIIDMIKNHYVKDSFEANLKWVKIDADYEDHPIYTHESIALVLTLNKLFTSISLHAGVPAWDKVILDLNNSTSNINTLLEIIENAKKRYMENPPS